MPRYRYGRRTRTTGSNFYQPPPGGGLPSSPSFPPTRAQTSGGNRYNASGGGSRPLQFTRGPDGKYQYSRWQTQKSNFFGRLDDAMGWADDAARLKPLYGFRLERALWWIRAANRAHRLFQIWREDPFMTDDLVRLVNELRYDFGPNVTVECSTGEPDLHASGNAGHSCLGVTSVVHKDDLDEAARRLAQYGKNYWGYIWTFGRVLGEYVNPDFVEVLPARRLFIRGGASVEQVSKAIYVPPGLQPFQWPDLGPVPYTIVPNLTDAPSPMMGRTTSNGDHNPPRTPPGRRTRKVGRYKERKVRAPKWFGKIAKYGIEISEVYELVDCAFKALPKERRKKAPKTGRTSRSAFKPNHYYTSIADKSRMAYLHYDEIDMEKFFACALQNHLEDMIWGAFHSGAARGRDLVGIPGIGLADPWV